MTSCHEDLLKQYALSRAKKRPGKRFLQLFIDVRIQTFNTIFCSILSSIK